MMIAKFARSFIVSAALTAAISLVLIDVQVLPAAAQTCEGNYPPPPITGADLSGQSITGLADQRFNQMITNRVLGTVLLGVNEQVNCSDCVSAFGSAGSFSAGIHGRKNLTSNLSLLAGIAYTQYSEGGYSVTSAPIGAFALRYDFADWGSSRPFFDIGTVLSPFEKVRYRRSYMTSLGAVTLDSSTSSSDYGAYGRAGWISRLSPRDEVAASVEVWQLWQRVKGYTDPAAVLNPFDASIATGTDRTNLVKVGGQWTHLFGSSVEGNINGAMCSRLRPTPASSPPSPATAPWCRRSETRAGSNMAAASVSALPRAGSPISSSTAL
jgi:hypothetical protein